MKEQLIEVNINKTINGHQVYFRIDNQIFFLEEQIESNCNEHGTTSKDMAEWYRDQLRVAFDKLK